MKEQQGTTLTEKSPPELFAIYLAALALDQHLGVNSTVFHLTTKNAAYCSTVWQYDDAPGGPTQYRMTLGAVLVGHNLAVGQPPYLVSQWTVQRRTSITDPGSQAAATWTDWEKFEQSGMAQDRRHGLPVLWNLLQTHPWWKTLAAMRERGAREAMDTLHDPAEIEQWAAWGGARLGG